jgi:hypothetical protein
VKEQSHKSEMRAALRGDFERLRARRDDAATPVAVEPPIAAPVDAPEALPPVEPVVSEPAVADAPPRSSWLDRLRDRR